MKLGTYGYSNAFADSEFDNFFQKFCPKNKANLAQKRISSLL